MPITRVLDAIRTKLVALIAEMRAGMPPGHAMPTREVTEQAVGVIIHGKGHRIVIQQDSPGATAMMGEGGEREPERGGSRTGWS